MSEEKVMPRGRPQQNLLSLERLQRKSLKTKKSFKETHYIILIKKTAFFI